MTNDHPHVILNVAMTADGKIDTVARREARISSAQDMARVDRLRAESDAVMVGGRTLLGDAPKLTVKSADLRVERRQRGRGPGGTRPDAPYGPLGGPEKENCPGQCHLA